MTLAGAELLLRLGDSPFGQLRHLVRPVDDERVYVLKPDTLLRFDGMQDRLPSPVLWQINAQGLRARGRIAADPRPGTVRIATYGDSETFGWGVDFDHTFQQQMERMDERLEVLNFGVPGYNLTNTSRHVEKTVSRFHPHLVLVLIHPNDFDESLRFNPVAVKSELVRRGLLLLYLLRRPMRIAHRRSPEAVAEFLRGLERIGRICRRSGIPLYVAFLDGEDRFVVDLDAAAGGYFADAAKRRRCILDLTPLVTEYPRIDNHLPPQAHDRLARFFYEALVIP